MQFNSILSIILCSTIFASNLLNLEELTSEEVSRVISSCDEGGLRVLADSFHLLKPEHLDDLPFAQLATLIHAVVIPQHERFSKFDNIPPKFFGEVSNIPGFMRLVGVKHIDELVEYLTPDQFKAFAEIAEYFPEISTESLNNLDSSLVVFKRTEQLPEYIQHVTPAYLRTIHNELTDEGIVRKIRPLKNSIVKLLPTTEQKKNSPREKSSPREKNSPRGLSSAVVRQESRQEVAMPDLRQLLAFTPQNLVNLMFLILFLALFFRSS